MKDRGMKEAFRRKLAALLIMVLVLGMMPGNGATALAEGEADADGKTDVTDVAEITKDGNIIKVKTLEEAFTSKYAGTIVKLLQDITLDKTLVVSSSAFTLDLNNHSITAGGIAVISCNDRAELTIQGSGEIVSVLGDTQLNETEGTESEATKENKENTSTSEGETSSKEKNQCVGLKVAGGTLCVSGSGVVISGDAIGLEISGETKKVCLFGGTYYPFRAVCVFLDFNLCCVCRKVFF